MGSWVSIGAGIPGDSSGTKGRVPIPVGIGAGTTVARIRLAGFTPHPVAGESVLVSVRVQNRHDVPEKIRHVYHMTPTVRRVASSVFLHFYNL